MKKNIVFFIAFLLSVVMLFSLTACGQNEEKDESGTSDIVEKTEIKENNTASVSGEVEVSENFVLAEGGTFQMGSPEDEAWRSEDEIQHTVTVSNFYMSRYELTQAEYEAVVGKNPSNFSGADLPVENVSWLDAVAYCNARSEQEGLTAVYTIDGGNVSWERSANGYRLPTEAEWEYACRAGTTTPFYMEISPSAEDANYYGHYPYMIEENYFSQDNLEVQPGEYRQTTVSVGSFEANPLGLYL